MSVFTERQTLMRFSRRMLYLSTYLRVKWPRLKTFDRRLQRTVRETSVYRHVHTYTQSHSVSVYYLPFCLWCEAQDGVQPSPDWKRARGRPPTTWIHQIHQDMEYRRLMLWSWQLTDGSSDKSQWQEAVAECFTLWMNDWPVHATVVELHASICMD